ncbi:MAG: VOC family protein [Pseudomonadales bacterium]|nr:VOC family protein [Pseudomonadales bacterium]
MIDAPIIRVKNIRFSLAVAAGVALAIQASSVLAYEIDPNSTIADSPTTLLGINHIALSVRDLDAAVAFYQGVTGYEIIRRETVSGPEADTLFGMPNIRYKTVVLEAPNMLFELNAFSHNADKPLTRMPAQGPGMTHTCFQSPSNDSAFDRFKAAGADILSTGGEPIDLGGYGVTYAYAYDAEGNMIELEQLDPGPLQSGAYNERWAEKGYNSWMTQVALVTHDIVALTDFYEKILAFSPYRDGDYVNNVRMGEITGIENLSLLASWFRMNERSKTIELWQYRNPVTEKYSGKRGVTDFGYSFSIEAGDIHAEVARMTKLGVEFVSAPVKLGDFWQVYAHDIDGNVFSLRQAIDTDSSYSIPQLEL